TFRSSMPLSLKQRRFPSRCRTACPCCELLKLPVPESSRRNEAQLESRHFENPKAQRRLSIGQCLSKSLQSAQKFQRAQERSLQAAEVVIGAWQSVPARRLQGSSFSAA